MHPSSLTVLAGVGAALLFASRASAQVVLVEPGHILIQHVDSNPASGSHPTQGRLEGTPANIESICVDRVTGDVYFQLMFPPWPMTPPSAPSMTTHIFRLTPGTGIATGIVVPIVGNTGFGIAENGADLHIDYNRGLLVTQDQNFPAAGPRLATVGMAAPFPIGTWCLAVPPILNPGVFGMDISQGAGGSVVPPGDIVFTGDVGWSGVHQGPVIGPGPGSITLIPSMFLPPPGQAGDLVIQPDGDWIWFGDMGAPITQILPAPPHLQTPSGLSVPGMFAANPVPTPYTYGPRAAVCDITGHMYVTCSGGPGGSALFRVDEQLKTATLVLTVGGPNANEGIQDLEVGPASFGLGNSVYFTVHDNVGGFEQIWEVSATACCPTPASATRVPDPMGWNIPPGMIPGAQSIAEFPLGSVPNLGNANFQVAVDDPMMVCFLRPLPTTMTAIVVAAGPAPLPTVLGGFGCTPGTNGDLMVSWPWVVQTPLVPWLGAPAVHSLPIPFDTVLCGAPVWVQGLFIDPTRPLSLFALTDRLDLILGS